jgi:2-polyprenyl-3-methyl-5-hydroxy-6-metoxy-1,4-benzoquinol methylase
MSEQILDLSTIHCIVCGSLKSEYLLSKSQDGRGDGKITLRQCQDCQTVFLQDWKTEFIPALYDYYSARISLDKSELYNPINKLRYEKLLALFKALVKNNRILDVGCGQGHLVDVAMQNKWEVLGIDLSESAVAICEKFDLPVKKIDFFNPILKPESFDVVTMFEVIEHVSNPAKFIYRAEQLLKPSGLLYLTTPNFNSLEKRILGAEWHVIHREHLTYFEPYTLKNLITNNSNLQITSINTRNISTDAIRRLMFISTKKKHSAAKAPVLREKIESSILLKLLKSSINTLLNLSGSGSKMIALCRKPSIIKN